MELRFGEQHIKVNTDLDRTDKIFKRAFRFGYTNNLFAIAEVIRNRDCKYAMDSPCDKTSTFTSIYLATDVFPILVLSSSEVDGP